MATEEWIKRAITNGKLYEDLPPRVRSLLPLAEWKTKVKEHCIARGARWNDSLASTSCTEQEYYEDLLRFYRHNYRLFPYHLADYVCRVLRVAPFRYYCDLLYTVMREEKSYDQIPNFAAADIVRLVGIGRNEYISIMNKCKAKKLLWKVNKSIVKEFLPAEPLDLALQPWWVLGVVNLGEQEYRNLSGEELRLCQDACRPPGLRVRDVEPRLVQALYKRGLIYLEVPIRPDDHVSIPPLEGFVSNKDSDAGAGDPLEALLYAVFVASSTRASVAELATILSADLPRLQAAISIACRLGFGTRLRNPHEGDEAGGSPSSTQTTVDGGLGLDLETDAGRDEAGTADAGDGSEAEEAGGAGQGVALVVDAEVTSYLMMGALSPGLKRHSVSLFEGGRITGQSVIQEMITELHASVDASAGFEGEMQRLSAYAKALATALETLRTAGGSRPVEVLRKESLAGLAPAAARRVLSHAYCAVLPIAPLPFPPLPLSPARPGPVNYGPTAEASTPWLQLALYAAIGSCSNSSSITAGAGANGGTIGGGGNGGSAGGGGPLSLVLVCGQRLWRLPPQLQTCTHALLWPWDQTSVRAQADPILVESSFLLFMLNEYLSRTALMVQPLCLPESTGTDPATADDPLASLALDVPLPLHVSAKGTIEGIDPESGGAVQVAAPAGLHEALEALGLRHALGCIRLLQVDSLPPAECEGAKRVGPDVGWLPLQLQLGLPMVPAELCARVCKRAAGVGGAGTGGGTGGSLLDPEVRAAHAEGQAMLQKHLFQLISEYGACSNSFGAAAAGGGADEQLTYVDLPIANLLFDGAEIQRLDYSDYQQGTGTLCIE